MEDLGRRSTFALGLSAAAIPALVLPVAAAARTYGLNEGEEIAPGVRLVKLGTGESTIPGYKKIEMVDIIFQPGKTLSEKSMPADMVCHMTVPARRKIAIAVQLGSRGMRGRHREHHLRLAGTPW